MARLGAGVRRAGVRRAGVRRAGVRRAGVRRAVGTLGTVGAVLVVPHVVLWVWGAPYGDGHDEPMRPGHFYVAGLVVLFFLLIAWQCWEGRTGPVLRSFRVLFVLLTPVVWLALLLGLRSAVGELPNLFLTPFVAAQACLAVALPTLALTRSPAAAPTPEGDPERDGEGDGESAASAAGEGLPA